MRRAALHEYLSQIEGLLDENRLPEAAAHCHFILRQYPRHVDTYRLLGRTLLEQQLFDEAIDVFARLLSAAPEDLVSHAGSALAHSQKGDLDLAIWHMERAFEIDPYNRAVQDELRKLYAGRDGDAPSRLALTRPALARLYLKGAMYRLAASELTMLLAQGPDRLDLQIALADSLFWDSRQVEAAAVCEKILTQLPFCVKANAILADAWLRADRVSEAREHFRRVQELTMLDRAHLNPDSTLGRAVSNSRVELPGSVQVDVLDDSLVMAYGLGEADAQLELLAINDADGDAAPEWLIEIGGYDEEPQMDSGPGAESEAVTDWLEEATSPDSGLLMKPDEEALSADEFLPSVPEKGLDLPPDQTQLIEATDLDELESAVATLDDSPQLAPAGSEAIHKEPSNRLAERDDEAAIALTELLSYIDDGGDDATNVESGPEWLEELADGSDVADELPEWLYEAVGLGTAEIAAGESEPNEPFDEALTNDVEFDLEQLGRPDQDGEPAEELRTEADRADGELDQDLVDFESDTSEPYHRDEVPDWLMEVDDVLEDLPAELLDEGSTRGSTESGADEEMGTWLDELTDQLDEDAEKPGTPGARRDE